MRIFYLKDYHTVLALEGGLGQYFGFYNHQRLHEALDYCHASRGHFRDGKVYNPLPGRRGGGVGLLILTGFWS